MTREEAIAHCQARNAEGGEGHWTAQEVGPGEWRAVRLRVPGLKPARPTGTATEARPRPDHADDPRPVSHQNIPPFGAGI